MNTIPDQQAGTTGGHSDELNDPRQDVYMRVYEAAPAGACLPALT